MFSVAMIGRNEAATLGLTLKSVLPYAGEIVFVDTGSTDATPTIAAAYGARVSYFNWIDDFSMARNFAISQCACDWILTLDCDEALRPTAQTVHFIDTLKNNKSALGYTVKIINHLPNGSTDSHSDIRLFRNIPEIRYANPIHESVSGSIYNVQPNQPLDIAGFTIDHSGYLSSSRNQQKLVRNLEILRSWIGADPMEPFAWYKLGMTLKAISADESVVCLFRSFELLVARDDRSSFAFRFELLQALLCALKEINPPLSQYVQSEGIRTFA
ncbi:MAG: glycosyltransferase family 2 protein [Gammaproteobacteria bacterium]|nr:glycosyltransferase family 2 protein [Gammaproteobacteria bacterium]